MTGAALDGSKGYAAMNALCAKDFGAARLCSTTMIGEMFPAPTPTAKAWVVVDGDWDPWPGSNAMLHMVQGTVVRSDATANCVIAQAGNAEQWFSNNGYSTPSLDTTGAFVMSKCNVTLPIACCGP